MLFVRFEAKKFGFLSSISLDFVRFEHVWGLILDFDTGMADDLVWSWLMGIGVFMVFLSVDEMLGLLFGVLYLGGTILDLVFALLSFSAN